MRYCERCDLFFRDYEIDVFCPECDEATEHQPDELDPMDAAHTWAEEGAA